MIRSITPWLAGALMLALLVRLGFWQLDRADEKRALLAAYEVAAQAPPRRAASVAELQAFARFERVEITGRYEATRQALLDAQVQNGRGGLRVWTPFVLPNGEWVLVDRGWVPTPPDGSGLPDLDVAETTRTVQGIVAPLPEPGIRLGGGVQESEGWPRRLAWPDAGALEQAWGRPVAPLLVLLSPDAADGFARDWEPVVMPPARHVGYAVQWFALALTLVIIIVVLTMRKKRND